MPDLNYHYSIYIGQKSGKRGDPYFINCLRCSKVALKESDIEMCNDCKTLGLRTCSGGRFGPDGMMDMIDFKRPVKTRGGAEARIYAHDGTTEYPIHGAYKNTKGEWQSATWTLEGRYYKGESFVGLDLVQDLPRVKGKAWVNINAAGQVVSSSTVSAMIARTIVDSWGGPKGSSPIVAAGVEITWDVEEGYGMEGRK